ncbi:MAG: hypothetical protein U0525_04640 [Patescibacteria group bacterium]
MTNLEKFIFITFGFWIYEVVYIRTGYFAGITITSATFVISFASYILITLIIFSVVRSSLRNFLVDFLIVIVFVVFIGLFGLISSFLSYTYDTSWDGQGYHQSAVIALANNWNPVKEIHAPLQKVLPSQIFAESYPPALWEIEASIYALTGRINSAKVVNFAIAAIAFLVVYDLLRKLKIRKLLALLISILVVIQPVFMIQLLTFMEDGFGYEVFVIALASLITFCLSPKNFWAMLMFVMAELLLVTTKYSHLPVSLVIGMVFFPVIVNRLMNKDYPFNIKNISLVFLILFVSLIFFYLPYGRNYLAYKAMFYPTNIPDLMGSVTYNNVPNNLQKTDKLGLLFYGIFSSAQDATSGDPRSSSNVAKLKIPFTFSKYEITSSAELYNNRVGGGGPLFSGIIVLSTIILLIAYFKSKTLHERYAIYSSFFMVLALLILALLAPTPNLLRYVNELQLLPFVILIPILITFRQWYLKGAIYFITFLIFINISIFSYAVISKNIKEAKAIKAQFEKMRESNSVYMVRAQQFYSNYILLEENGIKYEAVNDLNCENLKSLLASSTTTQYCERKAR